MDTCSKEKKNLEVKRFHHGKRWLNRFFFLSWPFLFPLFMSISYRIIVTKIMINLFKEITLATKHWGKEKEDESFAKLKGDLIVRWSTHDVMSLTGNSCRVPYSPESTRCSASLLFGLFVNLLHRFWVLELGI